MTSFFQLCWLIDIDRLDYNSVVELLHFLVCHISPFLPKLLVTFHQVDVQLRMLLCSLPYRIHTDLVQVTHSHCNHPSTVIQVFPLYFRAL